MVDNIFGLEDEEIITRKEVTTNLFTSLIHQNSLYTHKAKIRWLKGGEVKTSFFHKAINISRKRNEIVGLNIEGVWLMKLMMSRGGFHTHFSKHPGLRPLLPIDLVHRKITAEENSMLTSQFT